MGSGRQRNKHMVYAVASCGIQCLAIIMASFLPLSKVLCMQLNCTFMLTLEKSSFWLLV